MSTSLSFGEDLEAGPSAHGAERMLGGGFKFGSKESIEDGIQATVEKGQGLGDGNPLVHSVLKLTSLFDDFQEDEGVDADPNVVGQPAGEESQDEDDCGLEGLALLVALGVRQLGDDNAIAGQDDYTRQDEADHDVLKLEHYHPQIIGVQTVTDVSVIHLADVGEDEIRNSQQECGEPDTSVDHLFSQQLPWPLTVGGVDDGQVPVQTDEGQDEDTAVEVDCVDDMDGFAQELPKVPVCHSINCPEGKRDDKEKVGHRQVQPVLVGHASQFLLVTHDQDDQSIAHYASQENDGVDGGQEDPVEMGIFLPEAGFLYGVIVP